MGQGLQSYEGEYTGVCGQEQGRGGIQTGSAGLGQECVGGGVVVAVGSTFCARKAHSSRWGRAEGWPGH